MRNFLQKTITDNLKYSISIDDPCHEDWDQMTPNEMGRFCSNCQKTVIDFSYLSDNEIIKIIEKAKGKVLCGQFDVSQLNRVIAETDIQHSNPKLYKILLSLILLTSAGNLSAQEVSKPTQEISPSKTTQSKNDSLLIKAEETCRDSIPNNNHSNVKLRGIVSISKDEGPLYIVDGIPTDKKFASAIDPKKIKNIEVLKGAAAAALYGSRGANGVIIIETYASKKKNKTNK